jgi:hypothetical protein
MAFWGEGGCVVASPGLLGGSGSLKVMTRHTRCVVTVPARQFESSRGSGRLLTRVQFANSVHMAPRFGELIALSLLAGLGFGLALDRGDLIFVAVFGAVCGMAIIGGMQRFP